jgi:hypothetical protein
VRYHILPPQDEILYSIIQVRACSVRATSYGPPSSALCLVLHTIELHPGSHITVVGHPTPLVLRPEVGTLLHKLADTRAQGDQRYDSAGGGGALETMSQTGSFRMSDDEDNNNTTYDSQAPFGTQYLSPGNRDLHRGSAARRGAPYHHDTQPIMLPNRNIGTMELDTADSPRSNGVAPHRNSSPRSPQNSRRALPASAGIHTTPAGLLALITKQNPADRSALQSTPNMVQEKEVTQDLSPRSRKETPASGLKPNEDPLEAAQPRSARSELEGNARGPARVPAANTAQEPTSLQSSIEANIFASGAEWLSDWTYNANTAKVTEEQEILLTRTDHWAKPPVGHQYPVGSIPRIIQDDIEASIKAQPQVVVNDQSTLEDDASDMNLESDKVMAISSPTSSESVPEEEPTTSQISWADSPVRSPPKPDRFDHALPPDSSSETQLSTIQTTIMSKHPPPKSPPITDERMTDAQDGAYPPSSPPAMARDEPDDEDGMEIDIPQALGEDQMAMPQTPFFSTAAADVSVSSTTGAKPTILVNETPNRKEHARESANQPLSIQNQNSSGTSKDTSSTSIVYGTYNEPLSSEPTKHEQRTAVFLNNIPITNAMLQTASRQPSALPMEEKYDIKGTTTSEPDVDIKDTPQRSLPTSTQMPQSSKSKVPQDPPSKRKSNRSPSKIDPRSSKRREIKIVGFSGFSQLSQDPEAEFKQHKRESLRRIGKGYTPDPPLAAPAGQLSTKQGAPLASMGTSSKVIDTDEVHLAASLHNMDVDSEEVGSVADVDKDDAPHMVQSDSVALGVFERFKAAYPEYTAGVKHFSGVCRQMMDLENDDKMVPKWQWDDYIIRNRTDYTVYAMECIDEGEEPAPYHRFYKDHVQDTLHKKGIIMDVPTLLTAIDEVGGTVAAGRPSERGISTGRARLGDPVGSLTPKPSQPRRSLPWLHGQATAGSQSLKHTQARYSLGNVPAKVEKDTVSLHVSQSPTRDITKPRSVVPNSKTRDCSPPVNANAGQHTARRNPISDRPIGRSVKLSESITENTGNVFRDYVIAQQRMKSWTGSEKVSGTSGPKPNHSNHYTSS